ncbi:23S rRNA (guanosine(2251)-2'-O)-methyltransferase RlmB [Mycoplasma suis]|uniref:SpoU rRNA Methylase family protein n=2 Tax=Mycoplasma suis TaxID=57372 RepID=F0QQR9_MYCSL|nr:23S rRNA (guanosine(2251)-2'-O)-methyltransferase RlmB [Mycoplasma suis]ADX97839.1 spoU rRNA Methylase family protein [Mycoplasma suis str. Illinois]CBZ40339.1 SpoU rRNA methylase family protein [Mycoplasma suis KI3806]
MIDIKKQLILNGKKSVLEILKDVELRKLIHHVYLTESQTSLISACKTLEIPYSLQNSAWLKSLQREFDAKYSNVFAVLNSRQQLSFEDFKQVLWKDQKNTSYLIVMVEKIQDPYNFGAIIRTCVAAGVNYIIYSSSNNTKLNNVVLKTSQGYALKMQLIQVKDLSKALAELKKFNFLSYAASLKSPSKNYFSVKYENRTIIVLGNEGEGISPRLENSVDYRIKIPMNNGVESLNVSVANGILIYEVLRQWKER